MTVTNMDSYFIMDFEYAIFDALNEVADKTPDLDLAISVDNCLIEDSEKDYTNITIPISVKDKQAKRWQTPFDVVMKTDLTEMQYAGNWTDELARKIYNKVKRLRKGNNGYVYYS